MRAEPPQYSSINERTFAKLNELCSDRHEIFSMTSSPDRAQLEGFYREFAGTDYVRGLLSNPRLQRAIDALERAYSASIVHLALPRSVQAGEDDVRASKPLERKVRFIHRVAALIKYSKLSILITNPARKKENRRKLAASLAKIDPQISTLLDDDFFKESLRSSDHIDILIHLRQVLPGLIRALRTVEPRYPIKRERPEGNARARQLVNRLADTCYRIYGWCTPEIIADLTSYDWLEFVSGVPNLPEIVQETADRKVNRFELRLPSEDYEHAGLHGEWMPARTLTPPWMDFDDS